MSDPSGSGTTTPIPDKINANAHFTAGAGSEICIILGQSARKCDALLNQFPYGDYWCGGKMPTRQVWQMYRPR